MILILNASPRRHGNISQMVEVMADECRQAGVEVQTVAVQRLDIRPCLGCMKCRAAHKCVLPEDDAQRVLKLIQQADALVVAVPCYWGNIPGTLKLLFDRIVYGMMDESEKGWPLPLHKGKRCVLVSTSTTPWPFNRIMHQSSGAIRAMKEVCRYSGLKTVATVEKGGTRHDTTLSEKDERRCRKAVRKLTRY
ncbi:MAG: flavodoxin family protein [Bacteroidales bacterium]|nr:flavodoxin family protein [Bacteroidales bacterium]